MRRIIAAVLSLFRRKPKPAPPPVPYKLPDPDHDPHKTPIMNPPPVGKP